MSNNIKRHNKIRNDLSLKRFTRLTCISPTGEFKNGNREWLCICDCGKKHVATANHLVSGNCKSCGCLNKQINKSHKNWKGYEEISGRYWQEILRGARARNLDFSISIQYAWQLFVNQKKLCNLTNEPVSFAKTAKEKKQYQTASLDRIDSTRGYIEGNVQWVHQIVNFMKQDLSELEFLQWCRKVVTKYLSK